MVRRVAGCVLLGTALALAGCGDATGTDEMRSDVPFGACELSRVLYIDSLYSMQYGPESRGQFRITVTPQTRSIAAFESDSTSAGYAVSWRMLGDASPRGYVGILEPGRYSGLWRARGGSVEWLFSRDRGIASPEFLRWGMWSASGRMLTARWQGYYNDAPSWTMEIDVRCSQPAQ